MKVTVSVNGRFHAFDLAAQLHKHGHLHRLITTYPKFKVEEWGIPRNRVVSLLPLEIFSRAIKYFPLRIQKWFSLKQKELFDFCVSRLMPRDTDIFVGWSSNSLKSLKKAKSMDIITVLERGSSHMLTQLEILREEYQELDIKYREHHKKITEREIEEYEIADYISIPSGFVKRTFAINRVPETKLIVNNYGVNLDVFKTGKKYDSIFRVIYAGGFSIRKGSHYLLRAVYELGREGLDELEFWNLGYVNWDLKPYVKRYRAENIKLKGMIPQARLSESYAQGSVFVMPSLEEGLAMVQVQAMACGLPLIYTTNSGGEDLIEDGREGFVIPIKDVDAIKDKLRYLYSHPQLTLKMGKSARQKVQSGFTWDDYGNRMIVHYRNILSNH